MICVVKCITVAKVYRSITSSKCRSIFLIYNKKAVNETTIVLGFVLLFRQFMDYTDVL